MGFLLASMLIPFSAGLVLALTWRRAAAVIASGFVLVPIVWFVLGYLTAGGSRGECSDCGKYLGRWWEPWLVAAFAVVGVVAWVIGVGLGASLLHLRSRSPE